MFLCTGFDFFNALERIGLDAQNLPPGAAKAAWAAYGRAIMQDFEPNSYRQRPWGYERFGDPGP